MYISNTKQSVYGIFSSKTKCENKTRNGVFMINIELSGTAMKQ